MPNPRFMVTAVMKNDADMTLNRKLDPDFPFQVQLKPLGAITPFPLMIPLATAEEAEQYKVGRTYEFHLTPVEAITKPQTASDGFPYS